MILPDENIHNQIYNVYSIAYNQITIFFGIYTMNKINMIE